MSNPSFLPPPPTLPPAIAAAAAAKQEELSRLALRLPEIQSHQPPPPPHPSLNFPPKASPLRGNSSDTPASERRVAPHLNHEDDDHVDVEQCSDGEDGQTDKSGRSGQADKADNGGGGGGGTGEGNKKGKKRKEEKARAMKPKCNCPELMGVDCYLETKELWDKFNELGTEMIITKTGR